MGGPLLTLGWVLACSAADPGDPPTHAGWIQAFAKALPDSVITGIFYIVGAVFWTLESLLSVCGSSNWYVPCSSAFAFFHRYTGLFSSV